jgi:hypothetical protein
LGIIRLSGLPDLGVTFGRGSRFIPGNSRAVSLRRSPVDANETG